MLKSIIGKFLSIIGRSLVDGYTGVGGSYTYVVTDEDSNSVGWNGSTSCLSERYKVTCS